MGTIVEKCKKASGTRKKRKSTKKESGAMEKEKTGKYIKEKRISLGMTQQQLADKIQVTEKAVSRWETGRGAPDISLLLPLAKELKVSAAELLNGEDDLTKREEAAENKTIENVITYAENVEKQKYNPAFKASVLCFVSSFISFVSEGGIPVSGELLWDTGENYYNIRHLPAWRGAFKPLLSGKTG